MLINEKYSPLKNMALSQVDIWMSFSSGNVYFETSSVVLGRELYNVIHLFSVCFCYVVRLCLGYKKSSLLLSWKVFLFSWSSNTVVVFDEKNTFLYKECIYCQYSGLLKNPSTRVIIFHISQYSYWFLLQNKKMFYIFWPIKHHTEPQFCLFQSRFQVIISEITGHNS